MTGPERVRGSAPHRRRSNRNYRRPSIRVTRYPTGLPKVVVAHDHAFVAEVLRALLADRAEVVDVADSGRSAVGLSELLNPDVVVVGEVLVDGTVDQYTPSLLRTGARVLVVDEPADPARALELVALGVTGLVDTAQAPDELVAAVLALVGGGAVLPVDVVATVIGDWRRIRRSRPPVMPSAALTQREVEVLDAMADGMSTKAVAHHLGISAKTVENHKTRIFDKLGVRSQSQAVALALGSEVPVPLRRPDGGA